MTKINVEALLAKQPGPTNKAIQAALDKVKKQKEEEFSEQLIRQIAMVQKNTQIAVDSLRAIRKKEKQIKDYLTAVAEAEQEFMKDADIDKYSQTISKLNDSSYNTPVRGSFTLEDISNSTLQIM